jgi:demethylmenaquinone methyltransferase/2-methoxy-6-polyprenyl-1,4-benzoquinol methylase
MKYSRRQPETIRELFDSIAPEYDRANRILSLGLYHRWNQYLARTMLEARTPRNLCDLCSGTGEVIRELERSLATRELPEIHCVDFSQAMLEVAKSKNPYPTYHVADVLKLPFADQSFDTLTCAWGIRNVSDHEQCLKEAARVLTPRGHFYILELTRPRSKWIRFIHEFYLGHCVPLLGKWIARNEEAYLYLQESIDSFVSPEKLILHAQTAGFQKIEKKPLVFGIATLFILER